MAIQLALSLGLHPLAELSLQHSWPHPARQAVSRSQKSGSNSFWLLWVHFPCLALAHGAIECSSTLRHSDFEPSASQVV
ncbi:hypothetical protein BDZ91DRAFT_496350 [Kalaharituber pfeilii]|nr:hypothetical protein BDZ91DRAFT_496350 [Kalaharituber pfeilii]